MTSKDKATSSGKDEQVASGVEETFAIQANPEAEVLTQKVIFFGLGVLVFCLFLSWVAPKVSAFQHLIHWMGGH